MNIKSIAPIIIFLLDGGSNPIDEQIDLLEQQMYAMLAKYPTDTDFTFLVEADNGHRFEYSRGSSTSQTVYESASTSKLVTAAIGMWLVQEGVINLGSNPQDFLDFWPSVGLHSEITFEHLLSFTSGLVEEPLCLNLAIANFENCVEQILQVNPDIKMPGSEYYYGSSHMQVAGAMMIEALGLSTWSGVFSLFKAQTNLFENSFYQIPSNINPRLAGGMVWSAVEYMAFLESLYRRNVLSDNNLSVLLDDRLGSASITYSPINVQSGLDWHYGLGVWLECESVEFNCQAPFRVSSPGSFGAYPFIDFQHNYFGIVSRQGDRSTAIEGISVHREIEELLVDWGRLNRQ
ncbi:MAG: beta-lactamase family protein [Acidiferrobacterales bacterium]|nr:beta-lactamase family protein [Acidiferrobacterales bacterium]